ncbi:caspase family protein [Desertifilum sp. FACHB-1129]|uniref:caspase family protein n=1 Tax=unclassified Desertifilum TaxID=2621682 RepID=UPI001682199D|nr:MULTISPECIES: caspase family protein [unclassified Desertifilum]MBD2311088.1 caspase family protein [Desertifilum sp. FACHB-1129]MBD2323955.1 caspase family protein [Desertifilum sp. FACHB-866]MBD2333890.1 caspase family protein [Desertifilum sp. FACHB-868]MDA0211201.1 caspase family protein [Cyanobacteria bacterium FC1]
MSYIKRRHFLQLAGSTLATVGLSQWDMERYSRVLAQETPRKLALLVGINQYTASQRLGDLRGCVTDVELQEKLLIHRFGFSDRNILKLTSDASPERQPTRQNILTAFEEHLIKQAKPGDVVVFHFSGHGSRLSELDPIQTCRDDPFNSTLVPADSGKDGWVGDIMGRTLFLLMSALQTENVTVVLDSCYSGGGTRGNFRVRSVAGNGLQPSAEELAYQERWMAQLQLSGAELARRRCAGVAKGVVLASAQRNQAALDADFGDFSAGAFTYLMTQYLWQETGGFGSVESAIAQIAPRLRWLSPRQIPLVDGLQSSPVYFVNRPIPPSDAAIAQVKGDRATVWLGGIAQEALDSFQPGARFAIVDRNGQTSGLLELVSPRQGLRAEAKRVDGSNRGSLQPGMLLQEASRIVPANLRLSIGLDPSLAGETNAAKQALSAIPRLEAIPAQSGNTPYPGGVQYILSRMSADYQQILQQIPNLPPIGSIGLFTEALDLVPQSFGKPGEAVTAAIQRLEPKLRSFLAAYLIKKTLNANSSALAIEVSLNLVEQPDRRLARVSTVRDRNQPLSGQIYPHQLPLNQLFQLRVTNHEDSPLYLTSLLIDSTGGLVTIFPYQWFASEDLMRINPQQTLLIGDPEELKLKAVQAGMGEALVIASRSPMSRAIKALRTLAQEQRVRSGAIALNRSVEVMNDLLDDLSRTRSRSVEGDRAIDVSDTVSLSISFEVRD